MSSVGAYRHRRRSLLGYDPTDIPRRDEVRSDQFQETKSYTHTKMASDLIPSWIDDLNAWRVALASATSAKAIMLGSSKVDRSEACPCGSGRKYKKSCGAD